MGLPSQRKHGQQVLSLGLFYSRRRRPIRCFGTTLSCGRRGVPFKMTGVTGDEHRRSVAVSRDQMVMIKSGGRL